VGGILLCLFATLAPVNAQEVFPGLPRESVVTLADALAVAGADNPLIALADETVRASEAERLLIWGQLFPSLDAGLNYRRHTGRLQEVDGSLRDVNLQSLYYGFGADAKGAGTVGVPGIRLSIHVGDVVLAPRAASEVVIGRRFDAEQARHLILLDTATRYLALAGAQARIDAYRESLKDLESIETLTRDFAKTGQGRDADARRAESEAFLLRVDLERAKEDLEVTAADLARLLSIDPSVHLRAADRAPPLLHLIDTNTPLEELLAAALAGNPEIAARNADIAFQETRLRQERIRPWLPRIIAGFSAGEFGGGSDLAPPRFGNFGPRTDLTVLAVWTVEGLGFGNHARQNIARSQLGEAETLRAITIDRLRAEVTQAQAIARSRTVEMELARRRMESALRAFREDLLRTKNLQGRPIETLSSATSLSAARQDFVIAAVGYSQAQMRLLVALGRSP
jgi:outer membrane protein TolC